MYEIYLYLSRGYKKVLDSTLLEKRAEDLLQAFRDPGIDMILCAIRGDDSYHLLPYLLDHDELEEMQSRTRRFLAFPAL